MALEKANKKSLNTGRNNVFDGMKGVLKMERKKFFIAITTLVFLLISQVAFADVVISGQEMILKEGNKIDGLHGFDLESCQKASVRLASITALGPSTQTTQEYSAEFEFLHENGTVVLITTAKTGDDLSQLFIVGGEKMLFDSILINKILVNATTGVGEVSLTVTHNHKDYCSQPIPPDIYINLKENFSLMLNQKAIVNNENLEIQLDKILLPYCTGTMCIDLIPTVYATITKYASSPNETSVAAQIKLDSLNKSTSIFGYTITSTEISEGKASFTITKDEAIPVDIKVKFGEKFSLQKNQTARFIKDGKEVAKMNLQEILFAKLLIACIPEEKCPFPTSYATVFFTDGELGAKSFTIKEGGKIDLFDKYTVYADDFSKTKATFIVNEIEKPTDKIIVKLGQDFDLKQKQTATIAGEYIEIQFVDWSAIRCITTPCPTGTANFWVKSTAPSIEGNIKAVYISIVEGQAQEALGYKITLNRLAIAGEIGAIANLRVSKATEPPEPNVVRAKLDQKFSLVTNQWASILDETGTTVAKMQLQEIGYYKCDYNSISETYSEKKCFALSYARFYISVANANFGTITLNEGQEWQISGYKVRLIDIDEYRKSALFVVSRATTDNIHKVKLNENFTLAKNETAFVIGPDIFIKLKEIIILKSYPPQYVASISVWKNFEQVSTGTEIQVKQGETVDVFGVQINALYMTGSKAEFVVKEKKDFSYIINVFVNEPFWLKVNQSANVVPANIQMELLGINFNSYCKRSASGQTIPCELYKTVEIAVSSYLFEKESAGKKLDSKAAQTVVVTSTQTVDEEAVKIKLPPMPFNIYTLAENEEVTVNDYSIRVISIDAKEAQFVVKSKSSGYAVEYKIFTGWNLFSIPGNLQVIEKSDCDISKWKLFEYQKEANMFKRIKEPKAGVAYWLYNPSKTCKISANIRDAVTLKGIHPLSKGWNFVPATVDMVGSRIADLGNCEIKAVYRWNAESKQWVQTTNLPVEKSDIGSAFAVYSLNNCHLWKEGDDLSPPPLPPLDN